MLITGYAFRITLAGYLAMAVLLTHMTMALSHIIWVICYKRTSRNWKSISELIALSQNSRPAFGALANTGAGIEKARTFARVARIRIRPQPGSPERDHVELIFEDFANSNDAADVIGDRASSTSSRGTMAPTSTLKERRASSRERVSWTFPLDVGRPYDRQRDVDLESRTSATDKLIPRAHLVDEEKAAALVRVNQAYS